MARQQSACLAGVPSLTPHVILNNKPPPPTSSNVNLYVYNLSIQESETGGSRVQGWPGLHVETLSQRETNQTPQNWLFWVGSKGKDLMVSGGQRVGIPETACGSGEGVLQEWQKRLVNPHRTVPSL